jgi:outer membrane protein assembly factor BamB
VTMIDLGEVTESPPEQAVPLDHHRIRRAMLVVATIAGLLLLTGSARPAPPFGLRPLWSTPMTGADRPAFGPGSVYLLRGLQLAAYDLASGGVRWTVPVPYVPYPPEPAGEVVLLRTDPVTVEQQGTGGGRYTFEFAQVTRVFAAGTGAELWRARGEAAVVDGDTALIEERDKRGGIVRLRLTRLADGATIYTLDATRWVWTEDSGGRPSRVITIEPSGKINIFRYGDGAPIHSGRLPGADAGEPAPAIAGVGGLLAHVPQKPGRSTAVLYRPDDLTPLWRNESGLDIAACGPVLCVSDDTGLVGRDPATGRQLWRQPGMRGARPAGPGRLLLDDAAEEPTYQLIDATTGRRIGAAILGTVPSTTHPAGTQLILRRTTQPDGLTSVTRLDPTTGAQTLLGVMRPVDESTCSDLGRYLACPGDGTLDVTAVGRP